MPFAATQMHLRDYHTKWRKPETNTKRFSYTWNLKYDTNELFYETKKKKKKNSDIENRFVMAKEEERWERDALESLGLADANSCI